MLEPLLEIADSSMTYRRRYFARPQLSPVLDLLLAGRHERPRAGVSTGGSLDHIRSSAPRSSPVADAGGQRSYRRQAVADACDLTDGDTGVTRCSTRSKTICGPCRRRLPTSTSVMRSSVSADLPPVHYEIVHTTAYDYTESVAVSHHVARLSPRACRISTPAPRAADRAGAGRVVDAHGLLRQRGDVLRHAGRAQTPHRPRPKPSRGAAASVPSRRQPPWERSPTARRCRSRRWSFCSTRAIPATSELAAYARAAFPPGRPLLDAVLELTRRIHDEFTFDPEATTIATPLAEVFRSRRGVCQDFARLEIACLRLLGLPARYISGYLETVPPPGSSRLVGADASHAWLAVYCPEAAGLRSIPPTTAPSRSHVTVAWGRDYNDVSPIHGVILGGGTHTLRVNVDVARLQ